MYIRLSLAFIIFYSQLIANNQDLIDAIINTDLGKVEQVLKDQKSFTWQEHDEYFELAKQTMKLRNQLILKPNEYAKLIPEDKKSQWFASIFPINRTFLPLFILSAIFVNLNSQNDPSLTTIPNKIALYILSASGLGLAIGQGLMIRALFLIINECKKLSLQYQEQAIKIFTLINSIPIISDTFDQDSFQNR